MSHTLAPLQATAEASGQAAEALQQPDSQELLHAADSYSQPPQPLHSAEPSSQAACEQQPAVLQQPVLALLSSGLPPILLGSFQGDMHRARIILEAAGFLLPLDISSSLLPPGLSQSLPQQQAVRAELRSDQAALKDGSSAAEEAAGMETPADVQLASVQEGSNQGLLLPCMPATRVSTCPCAVCAMVLCAQAQDCWCSAVRLQLPDLQARDCAVCPVLQRVQDCDFPAVL